MKLFLSIFFLFSYVTYGQQVIEKCPENRDIFTYFTQSFGNNIQVYNWKVNYNGTISYFQTQTIQLEFEELGYCNLEVSVEDDLTCTSEVQKYEILIVPCKQTTFYIPNSFTPNNDGINDIFMPTGENFTDYEMSIFNRWGQLIFKTDKLSGWDGGISGYYAPEGVYYYIIKFRDVKNRPDIRVGNITLIR